MEHLMPSRSLNTSSLSEKRDGTFQRVTRSFLRSITSDPLSSITLLNLSGCGLKRISGLAACPNIEIVIASDNEIDSLVDLSGCRQLWKLDVSGNELRDLCGFEKFATFGTLIASFNQLNWVELAKISHLEILYLLLCGNDKLERDENYRKHVIKCLPKIWSLDGEIVSSEERRSVDKFFEKAAVSKKPVRLKLPRDHFVPSFRKHGCSSVIHGKRTADLCKYFAKNENHNQALDERRLRYLCTNFYADFVLESYNEPSSGDFLKDCLEIRDKSTGKWNMLVLLVMSSLVFSIPMSLMISALQVVGMTDEELVICEAVLKLPCQQRTNLISFLFSFIKLHGLGKGIVSELYDTMKSLNNNLIKVAYGCDSVELDAQDQHILAAEVVQIFCLVPQLSLYLSDENVITILASATLNNEIDIEARELLCDSDGNLAKQDLVEFLTLQIQEAKETSYFSNDTACSEVGQSSFDFSTPSQDIKTPRRARPSTAPPSLSRHKFKRNPSVGDKVLLGPQRLGHIVSKPDVRVLLVQVDSLSSSKYLQADFVAPIHNEHSLFYIKMHDLDWDERFHSWILNSRYQPTKFPNDGEKFNLSQRSLGTRSIALCKEPESVLKRSKAIIDIKDDGLMDVEGDSMGKNFRSKLSIKLPQGMKGSKKGHEAYQVGNNQSLKTGNCHKGIRGMDQKGRAVGQKYISIFQSTSYHLYFNDKTRYSVPTMRYPSMQKSMNVKRSNMNFIRKSNWMDC